MEDLNKIYKDLSHFDPHMRQNAVIQLGKYFEDESSRKKLTDEEKSNILTKILSRLEPSETSIEVKARTVRILSQIAKFSKENEIEQIFKKVITYIVIDDAVGKDIYVTCIKTILGTAPASCCKMIGKAIVPELTKAILKSQNKETIELCLDAFTDYIKAYDYILIKDNDDIKEKFELVRVGINNISSDSESLQTNAIKFVGAFSILLSRSQIGNTLVYLINNLKAAKTSQLLISYFNTLTAMAKVSAVKHIEYLKEIIPLTGKYCNLQYLTDDPADYDEKNALTQSALGLQEAYLTKIAGNLSNYITDIIENSTLLLEYDPNYSYENGGDENVAYEGYDDYEIDEVAAMDDSSWKVRKGAANVLEALVKSGIAIQRNFKENIIQELVKCLREHDENTKYDIIQCLGSYLSSMVFVNEEQNDSAIKIKKMSSMAIDVMDNVLKDLMATIISNLKSNNENLVTKTLELLPTIALMGAGEVIGEFSNLKPSFDNSCFNANTNTNNTIIFFKFLSQLFSSATSSEEYEDIISDILNYIKLGITHKFYLVAIEALKSASCLVPILASDANTYSKHIMDLYQMILPKFLSNDIDNGLKVAAIQALGQIVIFAGKTLPSKNIQELFSNFKEKMKNEALRPELFSTLIKMTTECGDLNLEAPLKQFESTIIDFITNIVPFIIKLHTLNFLEIIFKRYPNTFKGSENKIATSLQTMKIDDNFCTNIFNVYIAMINFLNVTALENIIKTTYERINQISISGKASEPMFEFMKLAGSRVKPNVLKTIVSSVQNEISNLTENASKLIAIFAGICKEDTNLINFCLKCLSSKKDSEIIKKASSLIGNICLHSTQSHFDLISQLEKLIQSSKDDELNIILAISIGKIGLSDPSKFTGKYLGTKPDKLTMYSMREFIHQTTEKKPLDNNTNNDLFNWLTKSLSNTDREFNDLCCECLGNLSGFNKSLVAQYINGFQNRALSISSYFYGLKFIFNKKSKLDGESLDKLMNILLQGLGSDDLQIKLKAFQSLVTVAHNYTDFVKRYYDKLLEIFNEAHKINEAWIETVDFGGGMKIKQDKGVGIRNAVYNVTMTFIEKFPTKVDISNTIKMCIYGLSDNNDIQNSALSCLLEIAKIKVSAFLSFAEGLCENLKVLMDKIRNETAKAEFCENIRRLLDELAKEHDIADGPKFTILYEEVKKKLTH